MRKNQTNFRYKKYYKSCSIQSCSRDARSHRYYPILLAGQEHFLLELRLSRGCRMAWQWDPWPCARTQATLWKFVHGDRGRHRK